MLTIGYNAAAQKVSNYIQRQSDAVNTSIQRLSTGLKVNSASDDPGDISFINRFSAAIDSQRRLVTNIQDNISLLQTADYSVSGTNGISSLLSTIREKSLAATNSTLTSQDKLNLQTEIEELIDEIDRISASTEFNTRKLINGDSGGKVTPSSSSIDGYAIGPVSSNTYEITNIEGASYHQLKNETASSGAHEFGSDFNYTETVVTSSANVSVSAGNATSSETYTLVFDGASSFDVYDDSGTHITSGSTGTAFTVSGLDVTVSAGSTYASDYKVNFTMTSGAPGFTEIYDGNSGSSAAATLDNTDWDADAMMNSRFYIKYDYDGSTLSYAAFDTDDNQMGSWVSAGSTFTAYSGSKLSGSSFDFDTTGTTKGDIWEVDFGTFASLQSAGGTLSISTADSGFSIGYDGDDQLSDIVSRINELGDGTAEAELVESDVDGTYIKITSAEKGDEGRLRVYDTSGDLASTLDISEIEDTGNDASITHDGHTYTSSTGYFNNVIDNVKIEVKDEADTEKAFLSVADKSLVSPTNIRGGSDFTLYISELTPEALGLKNVSGEYAIDVTSTSGANDALTLMDETIERVSGESARIGSMMNALDHHIGYIEDTRLAYEETYDNHTAVNYADELTRLTENRLQLESASAMLAQANLYPSKVMALLGLTSTGS